MFYVVVVKGYVWDDTYSHTSMTPSAETILQNCFFLFCFVGFLTLHLLLLLTQEVVPPQAGKAPRCVHAPLPHVSGV